jgi:hypothetical protein
MNPARLGKTKPLGMGIVLALAVGAAMALVVRISLTASHPESSSAQTVSQPNMIFILTDDMRYDDLNARYMPQTYSLLVNQGMTFEKAFVSTAWCSTAWCCPSRATTMRGQYAHNTGVWSVDNSYNPDPGVPNGGWGGTRVTAMKTTTSLPAFTRLATGPASSAST